MKPVLTMDNDNNVSKRIRLRQNCPSCGISLGKSSFYEHKVECSRNNESDSPFEFSSDDDHHLPGK